MLLSYWKAVLRAAWQRATGSPSATGWRAMLSAYWRPIMSVVLAFLVLRQIAPDPAVHEWTREVLAGGIAVIIVLLINTAWNAITIPPELDNQLRNLLGETSNRVNALEAKLKARVNIRRTYTYSVEREKDGTKRQLQKAVIDFSNEPETANPAARLLFVRARVTFALPSGKQILSAGFWYKDAHAVAAHPMFIPPLNEMHFGAGDVNPLEVAYRLDTGHCYAVEPLSIAPEAQKQLDYYLLEGESVDIGVELDCEGFEASYRFKLSLDEKFTLAQVPDAEGSETGQAS